MPVEDLFVEDPKGKVFIHTQFQVEVPGAWGIRNPTEVTRYSRLTCDDYYYYVVEPLDVKEEDSNY